jgi:hypothetical protein
MGEENRYEIADVAARSRHRIRHSAGSRVLVDPEGRAWTVYETDAAHVPGARALQCLIFDTTGYCFRLWRYPIDWRELTSAELLALGRITPDD